MDLEKFLNLINSHENSQDKNIFNYDDPNFDFHIESFYDSILTSIINKTKKDAGNFEELDIIKKFKKDISSETRNQYKVIISYCKDSEIPNLKKALKKYNTLHFLKFVIRIIDIDDEYTFKVNECKKYFSKQENLNICQYLYKHNEVPLIELKSFTKKNICSLPESSNVYDLIITRKTNNTTVYSLSPEGKNLYAFFMMKNIDIEGLDTNYNEGKVNEILEYLIQYISTQTKKEREQIKKPILHSSSASYNLRKLTSMLDNEDSYSQDFIRFSSDQESTPYKWDGGKTWEIY